MLKKFVEKDGSIRVHTEKDYGNVIALWTPQTEPAKVDLWIKEVEEQGIEPIADALWAHIEKHGIVNKQPNASELRRHRLTLSNHIERIKSAAEKKVWGKILT